MSVTLHDGNMLLATQPGRYRGVRMGGEYIRFLRILEDKLRANEARPRIFNRNIVFPSHVVSIQKS